MLNIRRNHFTSTVAAAAAAADADVVTFGPQSSPEDRSLPVNENKRQYHTDCKLNDRDDYYDGQDSRSGEAAATAAAQLHSSSPFIYNILSHYLSVSPPRLNVDPFKLFSAHSIE